MDYQSNGQSGNTQNTGEPNNTTTNNGNPYNNTSAGNGNSHDNTPEGGGNPYGNIPVGNGNPYNNTPAGNDNPYGNIPVGNGNPYGNTPAGNGSPYGNIPVGNSNPYNNIPNNGNPYGSPYNNSYNNQNPYYNGNPYGNINTRMLFPQRNKGDSMATAAMVLGIISLISLVLLRLYIPFLLGGVGIILAVLSKGNAKKMIGKARAGLICCITGLVLDIVLCVSCVYLVFALPDIMPEMVDEVNKICEEQYGVSYDEMMDEIYEMWDIER